MRESLLNTNTLPSPIRERFNTQRITVKNHESGVILMPLSDIALLRGAGKGSSFTVDTLLENRRKECATEDGDVT